MSIKNLKDTITCHGVFKFHIKVLLRNQVLNGMFNGYEAALSKSLSNDSFNSAYTIWLKKNNCVLSWLLASMSRKLVSTVFSLKTSKQVWDSL